jgi:histidinol-phosphate aminotransferase
MACGALRFDETWTGQMSRFWSSLTHDLRPYVPGEQPHMQELVKLNTNESPIGPSPRVLEAIRAEAADTLRLYPDPQATTLRAALAAYHQVRLEQVFVGNGSDQVLARAYAGLLKHDAPLLFPDITYSFYPVYCRLFDIAYETVPLDEAMQVRVADYHRSAGAIIVPNPNAPTGLALSRGEIATLLEEHPDVPVVIDEAYVDFGGRGLDQKGKLLELRFPPANRTAFDATHDALRRIGLTLAFYPYPDPLDNMICWPVSVRVDNV